MATKPKDPTEASADATGAAAVPAVPAQDTAKADATTPDFTASPTWGQGGRFVIDEQGQRVPAPDH